MRLRSKTVVMASIVAIVASTSACNFRWLKVGRTTATAPAAICDRPAEWGPVFADGDGTAGDPYLICTAAQLDDVRNQGVTGTYFKLGANIDLSGYAGNSFAPIEDVSTPGDWQNHFDGAGYTISDWTYNAVATNNIGLFAQITSGSISDVTLSNFTVVGQDNVGLAVGSCICDLSGITTSGTVTGRILVGGVAGYIISGTVSQLTSSADVTASGNGGVAKAGGITGEYDGAAAFDDCTYQDGTVSGTGQYVGGIVGFFSSTSASSLTVTNATVALAGGSMYTGGALGYSIGTTHSNISVTSSTINGGPRTGGVIGMHAPATAATSATWTHSGDVTGTTQTGGLIGMVSSAGGFNVTYTSLTHTTGNISCTNGCGGIVGGVNATSGAGMTVSFDRSGAAAGTITSTGTQVGGFMGNTNGALTVTKSYSKMDVSASSQVGGFVGLLSSGGGADAPTFANSYARGNVTSSDLVNARAGGFAGYVLDNTFSAPPVFMRSYASGSVTVAGAGFGGFVGVIVAAVTCTDVFWDNTIGPGADACGANGQNTANMQTQATFDPPWDFFATWTISAGQYPTLQ